MDFFAWQARKQGMGDKKPRQPKPSDIVEFEVPRQASIEVRELTASTTVIRRLRRLWTDKR